MTSMVFFYQVFGVYVFFWLPRVVRRWITLPLYQVLESALTPVISVIDDRFHFIFFHVFNQVRRWTRVIGAMGRSFFVRQEERGVEHVMDTPRLGKCKLIRYRRHDFADAERSLTSGSELWRVIRQLQICRL